MMRLPSVGAFPAGDLRFVYLHWTAADYTETFAAYHFCVGFDGSASFVAQTHDLRDNMRDVRLPAGAPYAAHTAGRNSYAIGVAACGMRGAAPDDFGAFALRPDALALLCATVAKACRFYGIAIDAEHVRTHAEAAVDDGYFGCGEDERWDIARLEPNSTPLVAADAARAGDELRLRIRAA
jgi:hypothetical protein